MPIPNPEPGLVISYLWHYEHQAGREEGQKDRPSVIVLAVEREAGEATVVTVLPITHSPPADPASALKIPFAGQTASRSRHRPLMDRRRRRQRVSLARLRPAKIPHTDRYDYGFLPPRFFNQILEASPLVTRSSSAALSRANDRVTRARF
jgi:hypothetical protein